MSSMGERIKQRRKELKISQEELSSKLGFESRSSISKIEKGFRRVPINRVDDFADALQTTTAWIMGWESQTEQGMTDTTPVVGRKFVSENGSFVEVGIPILNDITADFAFKVKDDSMINAKLGKGDIAFIRKTVIENGDIALVTVKGSNIIRRVFNDDAEHKMILTAENPKYPPQMFINNEFKDIAVLGKVVAVLSEIQ